MLDILKLVFGINAPHYLECGEISYPCAIGRSGIIANKREGDGGTPVGSFKLKTLYYRADKIEAPQTDLPKIVITQNMGWCDEVEHQSYNKLIDLPFEFSHEEMWRQDDQYDLVVEIDHNSDPVIAGKGSAVFIHVAREGFEPTAGCVALKKEDLLKLLKRVSRGTSILIAES